MNTLDTIVLSEERWINLSIIDGKAYIYGVDQSTKQVFSVLPQDCPTNGGIWASPSYRETGIQYVAKGRSLATAKRYFSQLREEAANGELA